MCYILAFQVPHFASPNFISSAERPLKETTFLANVYMCIVRVIYLPLDLTSKTFRK